MDTHYLGKNMSVTEGMKEHLEEKLVKLEKYAPRLVDSHVVLKKEKYYFVAEITLLAKNLRAYGEGSSKENVFTAMDMAYLRVEKQLKKFREKVKDHHKGGVVPGQIRKKARPGKEFLRELEDAPETPQVIRARTMMPKPMSTDEASMQLGVTKRPFLIFQNASTGKVNVIYKRDDGHHGLAEPGY